MDEPPKLLQITAAVMQIRFDPKVWPEETSFFRRGMHIPLRFTTRLTTFLYVHFDNRLDYTERISECYAAVLPMNRQSAFSLLLVKLVESRFRRIGIAAFTMNRPPPYDLLVVDRRGCVKYANPYKMFAHEYEGRYIRQNDGYWAYKDYKAQLWFQDCTRRTIILE